MATKKTLQNEDQNSLKFEREKLTANITLRQQEIDLEVRKVVIEESKLQDQRTTPWYKLNLPWLGPTLGATVAVVTLMLNNYFNDKAAIKARIEAAKQLEKNARLERQSQIILQATNGVSHEDALNNLKFYTEIGFLTENIDKIQTQINQGNAPTTNKIVSQKPPVITDTPCNENLLPSKLKTGTYYFQSGMTDVNYIPQNADQRKFKDNNFNHKNSISIIATKPFCLFVVLDNEHGSPENIDKGVIFFSSHYKLMRKQYLPIVVSNFLSGESDTVSQNEFKRFQKDGKISKIKLAKIFQGLLPEIIGKNEKSLGSGSEILRNIFSTPIETDNKNYSHVFEFTALKKHSSKSDSRIIKKKFNPRVLNATSSIMSVRLLDTTKNEFVSSNFWSVEFIY